MVFIYTVDLVGGRRLLYHHGGIIYYISSGRAGLVRADSSSHYSVFYNNIDTVDITWYIIEDNK